MYKNQKKKWKRFQKTMERDIDKSLFACYKTCSSIKVFFQYGKVSIFGYNIRSKAMAWWNYVLIVVAVVLLAGAYFYKKSKG